MTFLSLYFVTTYFLVSQEAILQEILNIKEISMGIINKMNPSYYIHCKCPKNLEINYIHGMGIYSIFFIVNFVKKLKQFPNY